MRPLVLKIFVKAIAIKPKICYTKTKMEDVTWYTLMLSELNL